MKTDVEWPDRRGDVLSALELLADEPPELTENGADPRWPDLTNAVHWLVDDTWWDQTDPDESIGTILRSDAEAAVIRMVVGALVDVADRQSANASDASWFGDPGWPIVRELATIALKRLREGGRGEDQAVAQVRAVATRWLSDDAPGFIEVVLTDAHQIDHIIQEKVPVLSLDQVSSTTAYPREIWIDARLLSREQDMVTVRLAHSVESLDGRTEFEIRLEHLRASDAPA